MDRTAIWIGEDRGPELRLARRWLATIVPLVVHPDAASAIDRHGPRPSLALLACPRPGSWSVPAVARIAAALPLVPLFAVTTSLAEGGRRNGDTLPGVEEIPWLELPGVAWRRWRPDVAEYRSLPATSRRDERWLSRLPAGAAAGERVAVVADTGGTEAVCDLLEAAGCTPHPLPGRRPVPGCVGPVVWAVGAVGEEQRQWLRLLTADGRRDVLVLESFPCGDGVVAALAAGAAAVLPRVVAADCLAGTLGWIAWRAAADALGACAGGR